MSNIFLPVLILPSLGTDFRYTKNRAKYKVIPITKITNSEYDLSNTGITLTTKIGDPENDISNKNVLKSSRRYNPNITSTNRLDDDDDPTNFTMNLSTEIDDNNDLSNRSTTLSTKIVNPEHDLFNESTKLVELEFDISTQIDDSDYDLSTKSMTLTKKHEYDLSNKSMTASTKINDLEDDLSLGNINTPITFTDLPRSNLRPNRRQHPGQYSQLKPPHDPEIARLLNEYREFAKKYGKGSSNAPEAYYNEDDHFDVVALENSNERLNGPRGPIRHSPRWRKYTSVAVIRQGEEAADGNAGGGSDGPSSGGPVLGQAPTINLDAPPPGGDQGGQATTQNEAQGAASRFTTRTTTTRRRRRTPSNRVSLTEDCDYKAYYCLRAYETGQVCAQTIYFISVTFKNYCMIDFVNCVERHDIWAIKHMGECFVLDLLTHYRYLSYKDESHLDKYYIIDDV